MCGRLACNLKLVSYCYVGSYCDKEMCEIVELGMIPPPNNCRQFIPSNNISPKSFTPVIVSAPRLIECTDMKYGITPMYWGLIPSYHRGNPANFDLNTINCRVEKLMSSKVYKKPFLDGNRCVVLCEGFYKWKTSNNAETRKQPYFVYMKQRGPMRAEIVSSWDVNQHWDQRKGWSGARPVKMAGIYNKWSNDDGQELYTYAILTTNSPKYFEHIHNRLPVVLETEELVQDWLDADRVPADRALEMLKPPKNLNYHAVSTNVNNSNNTQDDSVNQPIPMNESMALRCCVS